MTLWAFIPIWRLNVLQISTEHHWLAATRTHNGHKPRASMLLSCLCDNDCPIHPFVVSATCLVAEELSSLVSWPNSQTINPFHCLPLPVTSNLNPLRQGTHYKIMSRWTKIFDENSLIFVAANHRHVTQMDWWTKTYVQEKNHLLFHIDLHYNAQCAKLRPYVPHAKFEELKISQTTSRKTTSLQYSPQHTMYNSTQSDSVWCSALIIDQEQ
jgi:hypothetical protein